MIHNTVNYLIPYEPHFKMILFPFFPKLTVIFKPSLKKSALWGELNFITTKKLKDICRSIGLEIKFKREVMLKTFKRFNKHKEFKRRHRFIFHVYNLLKFTKLSNALNLIPISLTTPIVFISSKTLKTKEK